MKQKLTAQSNILDWYKIAFPTDEDMFDEMNDKATFSGLFDVLVNHRDVYMYIGVGDSCVRERVFEMFNKVMNKVKTYYYLPSDSYNQPNGHVIKKELTEAKYAMYKNNYVYIYDKEIDADRRAQA